MYAMQCKQHFSSLAAVSVVTYCQEMEKYCTFCVCVRIYYVAKLHFRNVQGNLTRKVEIFII